MSKTKTDTTLCVHCKVPLMVGLDAQTHYPIAHPEKQPKAEIFSISGMISLAPNLTIKPLGHDVNLVVRCDCQAGVCYNTASCRGQG